MAISMADIEAIVAQFEKSDWRQIELVADGVELRLSKDQGGMARPIEMQRPPEVATPAPAEAPAAVLPPTGLVVPAPSLGTFYRAPKPGELPFVEVGQLVSEGQDLCLVEVMKLFTTVQAPRAGVILAIHAVDGELVEFGQPLVSIEPSANAQEA